MNIKLIKDIIFERNPKATFLEKIFDKALMGTAKPYNKNYIAVYDSDKCIKILMKKFNLGELEAFEQFQETIELSLPSENKPIFFSDFRKIKEPPISDIDKNTTLDKII